MNINDFKNDVSSSAYKKVDGEIKIIGKNGEVTLMDDEFDIFIIRPKLQPHSERMLSSLIKKLPSNLRVTRLNGEAYLKCKDVELVREMFPILGIRKRKTLSNDVRERLSKNMKAIRNGREIK